jgi:hypothetical protein
LQRLSDAFQAGRLSAQSEPDGLEPEQIIVMEIAGELKDFVKAVNRISGLEFLVEELLDKVDPDEFAVEDSKGRRRGYRRQLLLVASDRAAWQQILSLWERFKREEQFPHGLTKFRDLFEWLRELRPWDDRDRLERTGALDAWREELVSLRDELVEFEAELWLRNDADRRSAAVDGIRSDLESAGGELIAQTVLEEIGYHGVLGRVPAHLLQSAAENHEVQWLRTGAVRFFHATGQIAAIGEDVEEETQVGDSTGESGAAGRPRIALLDGVPLANHASLAERVVLDDPDNWEAVTPVDRRVHGTGMASLILRGDLSAESAPLQSPIYVRPILKADAPSWVTGVREELPRDRLPVDIVHTAVARLFENEALAPEVRVIVLAVGDSVQQFDRIVSPLARLIDWLSERYGVLFILAAGNHLHDLELPADIDLGNAEELQHEVLCALQKDASMRRLLAPAEAVNAVTVGASHGDASGAQVDDGRVEAILAAELPNTVSALGSGARRSVKPDILFPGGRQTLQLEPSQDGEGRRLSITRSRRPPGVKMAAAASGNLNAASYATGTSVATALAGHQAGRLLERLDYLRSVHEKGIPGPEFDAVLLKAALVHRADWGAAHALIDGCQEDLGRGRSREAVARLVGYGTSQSDSLICDEHRATAVGAGRLVEGKADVFRLPLPPSLGSQTTPRRVTVTLAWLTPINPEHRHYRRAALKVEADGFPDFLGRRSDADDKLVARGTLQHEVFESERASPFQGGNGIDLVVSCREDAGSLTADVRYALIATIEVAESVALPIYEEIRQSLAVPVQVRTR